MDIATRGERIPARYAAARPARWIRQLAAYALVGPFALASAQVPAQTASGAALARKLNCMSCHAVDRTLLGPSLADIRHRYANQPDAREMLAYKIQTGGSGAWGNVPMPANTQVNDNEARALVDWILDPNR